MAQFPLFQKCVHQDDEIALWLRLLLDRGWSRQQKTNLLNHYVSIDRLYAASSLDWQQVAGKPRAKPEQAVKIDAEIARHREWLSEVDHYFIPITDERFPDSLRHVQDPPIGLFAQGRVDLLAQPAVAIVGSRRPTPLGKKVCEELATGLSDLGICVVSGMALGIDGCAHRAALDKPGATIAVLGAGIDVIYPSRHRQLHQHISEKGLLLSEYPLGYPATKYTFPDRNRLVSGLSVGTVIVEAADRSGTMITARLATEQNKELMVVPGPALSAQYGGSHRLIQDGAALVCSTQDVITELAPILECHLKSQPCFDADHAAGLDFDDLPIEQRKLLEIMDYQGVSLDELVSISGQSVGDVTCALIELELSSMVAITPEGSYIKTL